MLKIILPLLFTSAEVVCKSKIECHASEQCYYYSCSILLWDR